MLLDLVSLVVIDVDVGCNELALTFLVFYQFTLVILLQADNQIIFFCYPLLIILTMLVARDGEIVKVIRHYLANLLDCTQFSLLGCSCAL